MRANRFLAALGILSCTLAPQLMAQGKGGGIAFVPLASYTLPSTLASEEGGFQMNDKAQIGVGAEIEFGLSKNMGLAIGGTYGLSHEMDIDVDGLGNIGTGKLTMPSFYGMLSIRPGGRQASGAVTPLAIQLGGGVMMWTFDQFLIDTDGDGVQESYDGEDANSTEPFAFAGIAYNLRVGPRATLQLFGRAVGAFGYSSQFLDDLNALGNDVQSEFRVIGQFGVGLRIGR